MSLESELEETATQVLADLGIDDTMPDRKTLVDALRAVYELGVHDGEEDAYDRSQE